MGKHDLPKASPPAAPFNTPFAGLASRRGAPPSPSAVVPSSTSPAPTAAKAGAPAAGAAPAPAASPAPARPGPARAVVRMERAGRGGRTVTVVEKLGLAPRALEGWCGELKRALGCGGAVERDAIVVQGDVRERVGAWLTARGVRKVTLG